MADDELTRARRALREADTELDLARAYAESRARADGRTRAEGRASGQDADPDESWADAGNVEVLLRDASEPGRVQAGRRPTSSASRRGHALAWTTAAAAVVAGVLALSLTGTPGPGALPGSAPGAGTPGTSTPSASPSSTTWLTPGEVVTRAGKAMSGGECGAKIRSTLGDASTLRFVPADARLETPKAPLDQLPLEVLQASTAAVVLGLAGYDGTNQRLHDDLGISERDGQTVARIGVTPSDAQVQGGDVTRVELLVDTTTWLPVSGEIWAESDGGKQIQVRSELSWSGCTVPSAAPTEESPPPR
ncbi:hypothetical protein GCM10010413_26120 [Promicromonospora sukumoe]|uniref:Uncharacterized protein n=1 Tax=Promicromonospora sukumoe TaxID=88382 RepID=A0A7W3J8F9_9MICO|nr:hypothetical protein [Promicromonospora sukumoe]MBA8808175.1 hypothetical protein [Promicromonospora sukumoe]